MKLPSASRLLPARRLAACLAALGVLAAAACAPPQPGERAWFVELERELIAAGQMKADRLARDVPVTSDMLVDHFRRTAFGEEFALRDGQSVQPAPPSLGRLRRWEGPVPYRLSGRVRPADRAQMTELAARLSTATGREIVDAPAGTSPQVEVQILGPEDRAALAAAFRGPRAASPLAELFLAWAAAPRWPCAGEIYFEDAEHAEAFTIAFAMIYIRHELDGLSRRACLEEELSQSLGLVRDDSAVRPSIFNDNEEYALLTAHDEQLLRILYDPRLAPGMDQPTAMPLVRKIAAGMTGTR